MNPPVCFCFSGGSKPSEKQDLNIKQIDAVSFIEQTAPKIGILGIYRFISYVYI